MTVVKSKFELKSMYETPVWATEALLRRFPLKGMNVWECCAGNHKMADVLTQHGATVTTSDLHTYDHEHTFEFDITEMMMGSLPHIQAVVTNPPFGPGGRLGAEIIRTILRCNDGLVCMLMTAKFDFGSTRKDMFENSNRFIAKINLTDRPRWFDGPGTQDGTEDFAWYVWSPSEFGNITPVLMYEGKKPK